jgi:hypothetical protein
VGRPLNPPHEWYDRAVRVLTRRLFVLVLLGGLSLPLAAQNRPLSVLFIGNSYTYYNDLPAMLANLAASLPGPRIAPTMIATGGMTLQWHFAAGKATAAIESGSWDYVVLQEQSALGGGSENGRSRLAPPAIFHESVRKFVPRIRAAGAVPLLLMTWARRDRPDEQLPLANAYRTIADELNVKVAPVGLAWAEARRQWPDEALHVADGSHPNPTGSYLTACVLYISLTGRDPRGAAPAAGISAELAARLQALAWQLHAG